MDRFKLMETFAAVVAAGSYTRAARELGVTRAMVSKRVQDLEAALDVKLLNRNTHGLSLTATGADYFESCRSLLTGVRDLEERMQERRTEPRGEIKVLSSKTFGETVLSPIVAEFCKLHPKVVVHLTLADRDPIHQGTELVAGGFDMAVRSLPVRDSTLVARPIANSPRILVAAPDYLARNGTPAKPSDLTKHSCLDPGGNLHADWRFGGPEAGPPYLKKSALKRAGGPEAGPPYLKRAGAKTAVRVSGAPRINSSLGIRQAALHGLGIAILREYLVAGDLDEGRLVKVLEDHPVDDRKLYVVYQRDRHRPLRMKLFIDFITQRIEDRFRDLSAPVVRRRRANGKSRRPA
jgi:DNA-binding transcriptional LysR family regulator